MSFLVTGANGFIGSHLVDFLLESKYKVIASGKRPRQGHKHQSPHYIESLGNIQDPSYLKRLIKESKPDVIVHLAAQSSPGISLDDPGETLNINTISTIHLLDQILKEKIKPRIILASSSAVYASSRSEPIKEDFNLNPTSPYGISKLLMEQVAGLYTSKHDMDIVLIRPFFLIGPRKVNDVCSEFARTIVNIEKGIQSDLKVGNLEIVRDFLDIRDGIKAIYEVVNSGKTGEKYNISSGVGFSLRYILDIFKGLTDYEVEEKIDSSLIRQIDEIFRVGDSSKVNSLGWSPVHTIEDTLFQMIEYWRGENP